MRCQEPIPKDPLILDIEEQQALLQDEMKLAIASLVELIKLSRTEEEATEYSARLNESVAARAILEDSIKRKSDKQYREDMTRITEFSPDQLELPQMSELGTSETDLVPVQVQRFPESMLNALQ